MHALAVINRDSGSLKALDVEHFCNHLKQQFQKNQHIIEIELVSGHELPSTLEQAIQNPDIDTLIVCGGDGTASLGASLAYKNSKIFGLLPAGTMNLYARTLGVPIDLYEAAIALVNADIKACDLASVNDKIYIHQFSIGLQPALIEKREEGEYSSKITKALSGLGATVSVLSDENVYNLKINIDEKITTEEVSLLTVSNNPYGKDHLPYADQLDAHKLGLYWAGPLSGVEKTALVIDILSGKWNSNAHFKNETSQSVEITINDWTKDLPASLDGELIKLDKKLTFKSLPAALKILIPKPAYQMN